MEITKSLCAITAEIGALGKNKKNQQQGYAFRGIDDLMNTLHPLFAKYSVIVVPEVLESIREERVTAKGTALLSAILKVRYHFTAMDGSEICATVIGEGMDTADKASNKAMAVAMKYAMFQVFCIPTEEMAKADPDGYMPEASKPSDAQLKTYIDNCETVEDFKTMKANWGVYISGNADLSAYANAKYADIKKGGAQ